MKKAYRGGLLVALLLLTGLHLLTGQPDSLRPVLKASARAQTAATERNLDLSECTYTDLALSDPALYADSELTLSLAVTNTSGRPGVHELVLYLQAAESEGTPAARQVYLSQRIELGRGMRKDVELSLRATDLLPLLAYEPAAFTFMLGGYELEITYVAE